MYFREFADLWKLEKPELVKYLIEYKEYREKYECEYFAVTKQGGYPVTKVSKNHMLITKDLSDAPRLFSSRDDAEYIFSLYGWLDDVDIIGI